MSEEGFLYKIVINHGLFYEWLDRVKASHLSELQSAFYC